MSEIRELVSAYGAAKAAGKRLAMVTVISVTGPAYRGEGAKMLVQEGGSVTCMISGGCLEGEVAAVAEAVMETGEPTIHHFDLDEDVLWGLGIGCGGSIDVLIEPVDFGLLTTTWMEALAAGRPAVLAIPCGANRKELPTGRLLLVEGRDPLGTLGDPGLDEAVGELARDRLDRPHSKPGMALLNAEGGQRVEVFLDVNRPPPELVLFGAGHDAVPLAELAVRLGFEVIVVDARRAFATSDRFPDCRIVLSQPAGLAEKLQLGRRSYAVIMNHHIERDGLCLRFALESPAPYVGVLGPLSRYERMKRALRGEGFEPDPAQEERVHSPVGLDLGAEPPEEVALSILAEILARHKGHSAGFLNGHEGRIHARNQADSPAQEGEPATTAHGAG